MILGMASTKEKRLDLPHVRRGSAGGGKRRITGAEIVDRQAQAETLQLGHPGHHGLWVGIIAVSGHLEYQP